MIPTRTYGGGTARLFVGDCVEVMAAMRESTFDAIVCDPPYGLRFMSKGWDALGADVMEQIEWHRRWLVEAYRVLKPGGHLLAFSGTRTMHFLAMGLELSGFRSKGEVSALRDCVMWLYGSGFPKSLDVSKAIDKEHNAERPKKRIPARPETSGTMASGSDTRPWIEESRRRGYHEVADDDPITDLARQWAGWGTALKPAWEPCVVARKPLIGTVAANVERYGTGALNIDACRIEASGRPLIESRAETSMHTYGDGLNGSRQVGRTDTGRWPANVALGCACESEHDAGCAVAMLDAQSGMSVSTGGGGFRPAGADTRDGLYGKYPARSLPPNVGIGDTGGASRFFYTAKASRAERSGENNQLGRSRHPTVKPIALMQWLCTLVTPPGGLVLDPFAGSCSTLEAAVEGGFRAVGIDLNPDSALDFDRRFIGKLGV